MIENDAVMVAPDPGLGMERVAKMLEHRSNTLEMQRKDPLRFGYEPDIWLVCRALLGMDHIPYILRRSLADRTGLSLERCWLEWRDGLCSNFNMKRFCSEMLINGANRAGKTDFGAKLVNEVAELKDKLIWVGSTDSDSTIDTYQKRVNHYLPSDKRGVTIKTKIDYVNYTDKNGFTDGSFCLHGSKVKFGTYSQDIKSQEGKEYDLICPDEEVPYNWLDVMRMRAATRSGRIVCTFTPISGYTPVVADFQDSLRMVKSCRAYMLPRDGGPALPWMALGLEKWEYDELVRRDRSGDKMPQRVPSSRAEECVSWGMRECANARMETPRQGEAVPGQARPQGGDGRTFDMVPRVGIKGDGARCVVWFHGRDNPYGNPMEVISKAMANANAVEEIKKRVYGIALKAKGKRFKVFDKGVHVVA